ncbi:MAG: class I SAM-dependent methyltransferase [Spirochaetales bacterium]|nr:class I SAM-dependent methyltransferase [Spirochaetales bacterium]
MGVSEHIRLFDGIARPYAWFHRIQTKRYIGILRRHLPAIGLLPGARILDVGCGPGSFGTAFKHFGFSVSGVDGSPRMASIAASNGIECTVADATEGLPYADGSFDVAAAAYLAHGFSREHRVKLFAEMNRVTSNLVILHDFSPGDGGIPFFTVTGFLEILEHSDYIAFRQSGYDELRETFDRVEVLPVDRWLSWYVCHCRDACE